MITKFDSTSNPDRIERVTYRDDPVLSENHIRTYWWCRPGQDWDGDNDTGPLDRPTPGRILAQRQVRARLIVIRRIRSKNSPQVRLTKDQQSVQALAAHGVDQAFRISHFASFFAQAKTGLGTSIVKAPAHNSKT
jgi:hypothetical protein